MLVLTEHEKHKANSTGTSFYILYLSSFLGEIEISQCSECSFMLIRCSHTENTWEGEIPFNLKDEDTRKLICNLCGMDVT